MSCSIIASQGHASLQSPHAEQSSLSITNIFSPLCVIAFMTLCLRYNAKYWFILYEVPKMLSISDNLYHIHSRITNALHKAKRQDQVKLLCVSKTKPVEMIKEAYAQGERAFGESYATEAAEKIQQLNGEGFNDICWHFIGPIQKNKTKLIAEYFDVVESVDREIIIDRLSAQRPAGKKPLEIFIEVNISGESQKSGCALEDLTQLMESVRTKSNLKLKGLMGIAKDTSDQDEINAAFSLLKKIFDEKKLNFPELTELSMGMTHDLENAINCGSTEIRIGTAIFGGRVYAGGHMNDKQTIAFIGGGNMSSCIFESVIKHASPRNIIVSGPHIEKLQHFKETGASITVDNIEAVKKSSIIFLGVKPQILTAVLQNLASSGIDFEEKLVISMAAGYRLVTIEKYLQSKRIMRIMPNTPAKLGKGVTAVSYGQGCTDPDKKALRMMLDGMGIVSEGSEEKLNIIGAIAGCGPAFVYRFMEALIAEGCRYGVDEKEGRRIIEQLFCGTSEMVVKNQDKSLASLREAVTSKGGTTYAGLSKMSEGNFEEMMHSVIKASLDRTAELEKMF